MSIRNFDRSCHRNAELSVSRLEIRAFLTATRSFDCANRILRPLAVAQARPHGWELILSSSPVLER